MLRSMLFVVAALATMYGSVFKMRPKPCKAQELRDYLMGFQRRAPGMSTKAASEGTNAGRSARTGDAAITWRTMRRIPATPNTASSPIPSTPVVIS